MSCTERQDATLERLAEEPDASPYVDVERKFRHLQDELLPPEEYNFEHFRTRHLVFDARATLEQRGIPPGEPAPDFERQTTDGLLFRLSELRGRPVLLHFGSYT